MIKCSFCETYKTKEDFHRDTKSKYGHDYACKDCSKKRADVWYEENKKDIDKTRAWSRHLTKYWPTCTPAEALRNYENLVVSQEFKCKICGHLENWIDPRSKNVRKLSVDHCHKTNKVRGLLCNRCNKCIGQWDDREDILERAIMYLKGDLA